MQQRLDRAAVVHGTATFSHLVEGQREIEDLAGLNPPLPHLLDEIWQVASHQSGPAVQADVSEKQLLAVEFDTVRDADIAN
jgi:hypothetical protein